MSEGALPYVAAPPSAGDRTEPCPRCGAPTVWIRNAATRRGLRCDLRGAVNMQLAAGTVVTDGRRSLGLVILRGGIFLYSLHDPLCQSTQGKT